jgi:hypothetical protein
MVRNRVSCDDIAAYPCPRGRRSSQSTCKHVDKGNEWVSWMIAACDQYACLAHHVLVCRLKRASASSCYSSGETCGTHWLFQAFLGAVVVTTMAAILSVSVSAGGYMLAQEQAVQCRERAAPARIPRATARPPHAAARYVRPSCQLEVGAPQPPRAAATNGPFARYGFSIGPNLSSDCASAWMDAVRRLAQACAGACSMTNVACFKAVC